MFKKLSYWLSFMDWFQVSIKGRLLTKVSSCKATYRGVLWENGAQCICMKYSPWYNFLCNAKENAINQSLDKLLNIYNYTNIHENVFDWRLNWAGTLIFVRIRNRASHLLVLMHNNTSSLTTHRQWAML